jgi:hypothetical protein
MEQHHDYKVGDEVAIWTTGWGASVERATIAAVTATQVVVGDRRYMRASGRRVGDKSESIEPWTAEVAERVAKRQAARELEAQRRALEAFAETVARDVRHVMSGAHRPNLEQCARAAEAITRLRVELTNLFAAPAVAS